MREEILAKLDRALVWAEAEGVHPNRIQLDSEAWQDFSEQSAGRALYRGVQVTVAPEGGASGLHYGRPGQAAQGWLPL